MNWFERHLNWTMTFGMFGSLFLIIGSIVLWESPDDIKGLAPFLWIVSGVGYAAVSAWVVRKKSRSLWFLLWLLLPHLSWSFFIGLKNKSRGRTQAAGYAPRRDADTGIPASMSQAVPAGARYCTGCGQPLTIEMLFCPKCGAKIPEISANDSLPVSSNAEKIPIAQTSSAGNKLSEESLTPKGEARSEIKAATAEPVKEKTGPWKKTLSRAGNLLGILFIAGSMISLVVGSPRIFQETFNPDPRLDPPSYPDLAGHMSDYIQMDGLNEAPSGGRLAKKVIIIDRTREAFHPLNREINKMYLDYIQADVKPEEIKTVIWIESETVFSHDLEESNTGVKIPVYYPVWHLTAIDYENKQTRYEKTIRGSAPSLYVPVGATSSPWGFTVESNWGGYDFLVFGRNRVPGVELVFGTEGGLLFADGRRLVRIVGPGPWEETLEWLDELGIR